MNKVCRIGLDIAKSYFQALGVDKYGNKVFNKKLKRADVLSLSLILCVSVIMPDHTPL